MHPHVSDDCRASTPDRVIEKPHERLAYVERVTFTTRSPVELAPDPISGAAHSAYLTPTRRRHPVLRGGGEPLRSGGGDQNAGERGLPRVSNCFTAIEGA